MKNLSLLIITLALFFSSCRKETKIHNITIEEQEPIVYVYSSLQGKVIDETGAAIPNATVNFLNKEITSDENGNFYFEKTKVKNRGTVIQANIAGYYTGISQSNFSANGSSFVQITMMEKGTPQVINGAAGGSFTNGDDLSISIDPQSIIDENGEIYTGTVNVYARWIDPTDKNMAGIMPGDLTTKDEIGKVSALASYGMVVLALEKEDGTELNVKEGKKINVKIPIPEELKNTAPGEIDLWYFDVLGEHWLLNGVCNNQGGYYHCSITSVGYWNCDVQTPAICLSGQIFNPDSTFASYLQVIVEDLTDNFVYWGYTDSTGYFCGSVPQGALLKLSIKDHCDNVIYTVEIGPYAEDFELEDIFLNLTIEEFWINVKGTVAHCTSNDDVNGFLSVKYPGNLRIFPFFSGNFDRDINLQCVTFPKLKFQIFSNSQQYSSEEFISTTFEDVDLGAIILCEPLDDYFNVTIDGVEYWTAPTRYHLKPNTTTPWMVLEGISLSQKFTLELRDYNGIGTYSTNAFFESLNFDPDNDIMLNTSSPNITVQITADDGTYIIGTLSGTATNNLGETKAIEGNFKVEITP